VHWDRGAAAVCVPELLVSASLADLNELRVESWLAILEKHCDHFSEVGLQLLHRRGLAVRPTESGDVADQ
jgi:hypothetical protein